MKLNLARDTLKALQFAIDRGVIADDRLIQINGVIMSGVEEYCEEYDIDLDDLEEEKAEGDNDD